MKQLWLTISYICNQKHIVPGLFLWKICTWLPLSEEESEAESAHQIQHLASEIQYENLDDNSFKMFLYSKETQYALGLK